MAHDRRDPKRFEPPPWETAQFEELQLEKARQAQEEAAEEHRLAAETDSGPEEMSENSSAEPTRVRSEEDELMTQQMLLLLKAEEPPAARGVNTLAVIVSGLLAVCGAVLMIWGIVAFVATRGAKDLRGVWGSGTMVLFGIVFMALGVWQGYKTMEKRGVL